LRREKEHYAGRFEQTQQAMQERQQAENIRGLQTAVVSAVSAAEAELSAKDVDFSRKQPMIQQAVQALMMQEGVPQSVEAAVSQYRKAVKSVNDNLSTILPKRPAVTNIQSSTGGPQVPAAASVADAVRQRALAMGMKIVG
jgi:DNA repair exonuclease SbcCD ATPase subunit